LKKYEISELRNVAIVGHQSSGKTSLCEAVLFNAGVINRIGKIEEGNTLMDSDSEEIKRKISVYSNVAAIEHNKKKINLLDTPGYEDFIGQTMAALKVVEGGIIVISAEHGVEAGTEKTWGYLAKDELPRIVCVNKMDKEHADFDKCVKDAQDTLGKSVMPIMLPVGRGSEFRGVINILKKKAYIYSEDSKGTFKEEDIPDQMVDKAAEWRQKLQDFAAESDDSLLEKFLESGELTDEELVRGLGAGCRQGTLVPMVVTSATANVGVKQLVDMIVEMLPSPEWRSEIEVKSVSSNETKTIKIDKDSPVISFVFKSLSEKDIGDMSYIKVFSGEVTNSQDLYNSNEESSERIGQLFFMQGKKKIDTDSIPAGDIGAAVKLKTTKVNSTLCKKKDSFLVSGIDCPSPSIRTGIVPKVKGEMDKIGMGLHKLSDEDISFSIESNQQLRQTILSGQGEQHFDVIISRLKERYNVEVEMVPPKVEYLETISAAASAQGKHKKQSGGRGQYGDVHLRIEPLSRGEGFKFVNEVVGGNVPTKHIPAVEKGIIEAMEGGVLAGHKIVDLKATLFDGSYHSVDSSDAAFKAAGSKGFKIAMKEAKPVLLEPIMEVEVFVPDEHMGDVMGDLSMRRGKIMGTEQDRGQQRITAQVPLADLYRYSTSLRSMTQGRASHSRKFSHYETVPHEQAQKLIAQFKTENEESD
jgi:elongation factor G